VREINFNSSSNSVVENVLKFQMIVLKGERLPEPKFEIYKDAAGKFRFRLRAPNNEIIAVSEAYESKDACKNGIASIRRNAPKAVIEDLTGEGNH